MQWIQCLKDEQTYAILNVHGLWNGRGKTDTPERVAQSQKIRALMDNMEKPMIVCSDFNLRPDTESMKIIEKKMHNLITINQVTSTRTSLYPKEEKFADYILVSPEIEVKYFGVLAEVVSDHAPLFLEI